MGKPTGRAKLFQQLDEHIAKDYDPEAQNAGAGSGSDESDDNAGTEHYVSVGKSKLRQKGDNALGPQYRGSKVSRQALEDDDEDEDDEDEDEDEESDSEEYDDPENANLEADTAEASDSEISSDNALGESDGEKLDGFVFRGSSKPKAQGRKRATAADYMSDSEEDDDEDMGGAELDDSEEEDDMDDGLEALIDGEAEETDGSEEDEDDEDEEDGDEEDDEDEDEEEEDEEEPKEAAKPNMMAKSANADAEKGAAIQKQRKIYDGLLNLRIRLQKALIAANTFPTLEEPEEEAESEPYEAAEEAAIKLLNTISSLRENFGPPVAAGSKRKRDIETSMPSEDIWAQLQEEDRRAIKFRESRLEKWSRKVQSVNVTAPKGLSSRNKTLVDSLHDQLNVPDNRLVKRTRVPRSCAPAQLAKKIADDQDIFDDADFYQLLLKELVEQRTVDSSGESAAAVPSVVLTASRDNKQRKNVDRKASKGRKMRFTVHEKLQNFMAPEDRRSWEQATIDRFFSTLFGRKMELDEEESDDDMKDVADSGFKMFG
ncbi:rRNA-processing protein bfr2 [Lecanicillium sp. MT-2017a]|nr:rRNA-processing protein bfr2 [Lecanicillium sp. MT-2017a]